MLDKIILQRLKSNDPTLHSLNLENKLLSSQDIDELALALKENTQLCKLNLRLTGLNGERLRILLCSLPEDTGIREINLSHNPIGNEGACYIADILYRTSFLRSLIMRNVGMTSIGFEMFGEALQANRGLEKLDLSANPCNTNKAAKILGEGLRHHKSLSCLILDNTFLHENISLFSQGFNENTSLLSLDLSNNYFPNAEGLDNVLKNKYLKALNVSECEINKKGKKKLIATLEMNYALINLDGIDDARITSSLTRNKDLYAIQHPELIFFKNKTTETTEPKRASNCSPAAGSQDRSQF